MRLADRPIFHRPRTLAQARRRKSFVLTVVAVAAGVGLPFALAAAADPTEYCHVQLWADGTWSGVDFDERYGVPDDCVLRVWQDEP